MTTNEPNPFEQIFKLYAERLSDAPGASRLARVARSAKRIPAPLLDDLSELVLELDDPHFVGDDIFVHLIDFGFCDVRYAGAAEFVSALGDRLRGYIDDRAVSDAARVVFEERVAWWRAALSRSGELRKWPAVVLMQKFSSS